MKINGVEGIPSSLVACKINGVEVSVTELAPGGFSFRTVEEIHQIDCVELYFFQFQKSSYQTVRINHYKVYSEKKQFYILYTIVTEQNDYQTSTSAIIRDYSNYIFLKMSGDDSYLSAQLVDYPAEQDEEFYTSFEVQKRGWFESLKNIPFNLNNTYSLAVSIDNYERYQKYLATSFKEFYHSLLADNDLENHPLFNQLPTRLYIGNQFCHNLLPTRDMFQELIVKARQDGMKITLVFPYLRDELLEETDELLRELYDSQSPCQEPTEVVVNDWGMVKLLQDKTDKFSLSLGVLLNKRRKDPRYQYKSGWQQNVDKVSENNLSCANYRNFLREKWKISRYEHESCGYRIPITGGQNSLHLPYYQTNTSQYCTLYAKCKTGERGNQKLVNTCPRYCEEVVYLYPKHLKMIGKYNSLYAYDDRILRCPEIIDSYLNDGLDRIVLNLL